MPPSASQETKLSDRFELPWHGIGVGGSVALDFANTLDWRLRSLPVELLKTYPDLLRWARSAGVLEPGRARELRAWADAHPRAAAHLLAEAIRTREAVAAVLQALMNHKSPAPEALARLENAWREARAARRLRVRRGKVSWEWTEREPGPMRPALAAALDAEHLLTSTDHRRIRQCGDAECGWFFIDTSRNRSRRWCSMESCGNRNKARRFYRRHART